jgi:hypothetical protein
MIREHDKEVDGMTDTERRIFAVILRVLHVPENQAISSIYLAHSYPGVWGLKNAFRLGRQIRSSVVPFVCPQPAIMDKTVSALGGETKLNGLIDNERGSWWVDSNPDQSSEPESKSESTVRKVGQYMDAMLNSDFPTPNQICRAYGESVLHTVGKDLDQLLRLWTEVEVVISNLHIKSRFLHAHPLRMVSTSITHGVHQSSFIEWVEQMHMWTQSLAVPVCMNSEVKPGTYWHLTRYGRESLAVIGAPIAFDVDGRKVVCEGCGHKV